MILLYARKFLQEACDKVFTVESQMERDSEIRKLGYQARIAIGKFENALIQAGKKESGPSLTSCKSI